MRAAVVGNGWLRSTRALRDALRQAQLVICADGGVRAARTLGVTPHVVIGDFDSLDTAGLAWARRRGARLIAHPREKAKTDTELAVEYALGAGAEELDLVAVLGGRVDHTLANIGLLMHIAGQHRRARILDGRTELFLAGDQTAIPGRRGDLVSLLPLSDTAAGVTTHGLKYPLNDGALTNTSTRGVRNEIGSPPAAVSVRRGWLLVVVAHRAGKG
jgi:thiamine pyrophosphokinase